MEWARQSAAAWWTWMWRLVASRFSACNSAWWTLCQSLALMGKPSMEQMGTVLDLARDEARIIKGKKAATVRAVAVPVQKDSQRPRAQSYWNWLAKRMAKAPKSVQIKFQDVMERADDQMLAKFLDEFPTWALSQRQMSGGGQSHSASSTVPGGAQATRDCEGFGCSGLPDHSRCGGHSWDE